MVIFISILSLLVLVLLVWRRQTLAHQRRIEQIPLRIHVNGIRGKSTVTRLIAGVLREAGYQVIAKTTGSAARVIHEDGSETPIKRWGAATIWEQVAIVQDHIKPDTQALVVECMAVNPRYQQVSQHQIVKGTITVITNVREDHQDQMGQTLPEIASALANTIPQQGWVITGELDPDIRKQIALMAAGQSSQTFFATTNWVTEDDLRGFDYLTFRDNIAIALAVAKLLRIPRETALRGMRNAAPDAGAVQVKRVRRHQKQFLWAPLFAVNDRESVIANMEALRAAHSGQAVRVGILNNRPDRAARALQFADIAANDLKLDYYILTGAYKKQVAARLEANGYPRGRILIPELQTTDEVDALLRGLAERIPRQQFLLAGLVNIHTEEAELFHDYFGPRPVADTAANQPANLAPAIG